MEYIELAIETFFLNLLIATHTCFYFIMQI